MTGIPDEAVEAFVEAFRRRGAWGAECVRAGLAAALPHLADAIRADERAKTAREIHDKIVAVSAGSEVDPPAEFAYGHSAAVAWWLRVPDCGDQYHGADGGPCTGCGFDVAADVQDPASGTAPTQSHQPTPESRPTAATGALNDVPQRNPNPMTDDPGELEVHALPGLPDVSLAHGNGLVVVQMLPGDTGLPPAATVLTVAGARRLAELIGRQADYAQQQWERSADTTQED